MNSHHNAIAKASFAAACLRPDITQITRDEVANFHFMLENAILQCSPSNIQTCKQWILDNVVLSSQRTFALSKYLVSYSKLATEENTNVRTGQKRASVARKRLHILYILNDLLHHAKHHVPDPTSARHLEEAFQPRLVELVHLTRSEKKSHVDKRLEGLLVVWDQEQYFSEEILTQLRKEHLDSARDESEQKLSAKKTTVSKELPYIMPATHGDPTTPYYDLPAANLMPHIVPNKSIPMRIEQIKALQLSAGPADESLINAVRDFLKDVDRMNNPYQSLEDDGVIADVDNLGQLSYRNEADEVVGDTYYGWSKEFCHKMKSRSKEEGRSNGRQRSRSYSRSRSSSRSRSRSRSQLKRRRRDSSRSSSPMHGPGHRLRSRSGSLDRTPVVFQQAQTASIFSQPTTSTTAAFTAQSTQYPNIVLGPDEFPVPPPRPPGYGGPWPPPPPPPPPSMEHMGLSFTPSTQYNSGSRGAHSFHNQHNR